MFMNLFKELRYIMYTLRYIIQQQGTRRFIVIASYLLCLLIMILPLVNTTVDTSLRSHYPVQIYMKNYSHSHS